MFIDVDLDEKTQTKLRKLLRESIVRTFDRGHSSWWQRWRVSRDVWHRQFEKLCSVTS